LEQEGPRRVAAPPPPGKPSGQAERPAPCPMVISPEIVPPPGHPREGQPRSSPRKPTPVIPAKAGIQSPSQNAFVPLPPPAMHPPRRPGRRAGTHTPQAIDRARRMGPCFRRDDLVATPSHSPPPHPPSLDTPRPASLNGRTRKPAHVVRTPPASPGCGVRMHQLRCSRADRNWLRGRSSAGRAPRSQ
jgi:hypothetical protein